MTAVNRFPHGKCECTTGNRVGIRSCCGGEGPAAYAALRSGAPMLLCTRCIVPSDGAGTLLVTLDDPIRPYRDHDKLGAALIMAEISGDIAKEGLDEQLDEVARLDPGKEDEVRKLKERLDAVHERTRAIRGAAGGKGGN